LPNPGAVTLIDVTLAAHNPQQGGPEYSVGAAAIHRAREKHDMYNLTFDFSSDAVRLEVFAFETSGHYIERDASFFVPMLQQQIPTILAYSSATFSKHYQLLFKLHVPSVS
jgi:hypothetical protein